jgi:hypothetical protein
MISHKSIITIAFAAVFALQAAGELSNTIISADRIVAAMNDAGIEVSMGRVTFLTDAVAKTRNPDLRIESVRRWDSHKIRVQLDCVKVQECVPFFVAVSWDQKDAVPIPSRGINSAVPVGSAIVNPIVVRSSSPAILRLDGSHIHVWIPVICLENGAVGQLIHASSRDGRQTYEAEVLGSRRLRGGL